MMKLLDTQCWRVQSSRLPYGRFKLTPISSYGPQPKDGDLLVRATALAKATTAMKAAVEVEAAQEAKDIILAALRDLED